VNLLLANALNGMRFLFWLSCLDQNLTSMKRISFVTLALLFLFQTCGPAKPDPADVRKKVGQMFLLAFSGNQAEKVLPFIEERGIGGLYLSNENLGSPKEAAMLLNKLQEASINGISGLPLLTAGDQEGAWGVMVGYSATGPGNMALGAAPVEHTANMYSVFANELGAIGMFCDLSPVADVNSNPDNPIIGTRSFGENADEVAARVSAAVKALQSNGIIATAKHFPGHGNTDSDSHSGLPKVTRSLEEIETIDLKPFKAAVDAGVDMVMTAHIIYEALDKENPSTLSEKILTGYLRNKLGFKGVIITDSFNMWAIQKNYDPGEAAIKAILAGADMIMLAEERYGEDVGDYVKAQTQLIDRIEKAVMDGEIPMERINESYERIKSLKEKYHLATRVPVYVEMAGTMVGTDDNKAVAVRASEAALLKNDPRNLVPLKAGATVAVCRLAVEDVAEIIRIAEGIGPNYANAYADFVIELKNAGFKVNEFKPGETIPFGEVILAVSENYPLPGKSLDLKKQRERLAQVKSMAKNPLLNVALKDPYDANLISVDAWVCAVGSNISNIQAVVNLLAGKVEANGKWPVSPVNP
jgi:beta-N-acetylhexosaminidase